SPDAFILLIGIGNDVWSEYIRSGLCPIALHSFSLGGTCENITWGAAAVDMLQVKSDNSVDFPTIYPAVHGVIDVVDRVIPGHGLTFSLGIGEWGRERKLFNPG